MAPRRLKYGVRSNVVLFEIESLTSLGGEAYIEPPIRPSWRGLMSSHGLLMAARQVGIH